MYAELTDEQIYYVAETLKAARGERGWTPTHSGFWGTV